MTREEWESKIRRNNRLELITWRNFGHRMMKDKRTYYYYINNENINGLIIGIVFGVNHDET